MLLNEVMHLSFSLRLLGRAVPLDGDQQIRLIDLLTRRSRESIKTGAPKVKCFDNRLGEVLACMYFFGIPLVISLGSLPTWRLKNGKVA